MGYNRLVCNVGISGDKYPITNNGVKTKEYDAWYGMLRRCYSEKYHAKCPTYKDVTVCDEWLYYPNFYEWLHEQENFEKWLNGNMWALDKDILVKGNKIYSPDTCCLVPDNINKLLIKSDKTRGIYLIGACYKEDLQKFEVFCCNPKTKKQEYVGVYQTELEAFKAYKNIREFYIKQIATEEFEKGNITKKCYDSLKKYQIEITD